MPELSQRFEELVRLLVDQPEAVELALLPGRRDTLLELRVAPDDLGKVIGRQGRTARALRTLLDARADRDGVRYELEILEEDD
ncbi:MAG TPA: KH domain-containing protein [Thermoanaerobaculia bacterium]|nr:KH domain-containing protein [Thermoanaerobaculia bacterium]